MIPAKGGENRDWLVGVGTVSGRKHPVKGKPRLN